MVGMVGIVVVRLLLEVLGLLVDTGFGQGKVKAGE